MWNPNRRSLAFGLACALIGAIFGLAVFWQAAGEGYRFFFLASGAAGLVCGSLLWRVLPERQVRWRIVWAALAGGLSGVTAHYVTWLLVMWAARLCYRLTGGCTGSLGEPPVTAWQALWGAAAFSVFSLVIFGWLSTLLGGLTGGALGWVWFHLLPAGSTLPDPPARDEAGPSP